MNTRFSRQSFLGEESQDQIAACTVGVIGLGGGGSHVVQQLAHIGFQNFVIYDDDIVEDSNLNRLIGGRSVDARAETPKLHLAKMMILGLQPQAEIRAYPAKWQAHPEPLRECDIIFGCVDGYKQRQEIEVLCRRYLVHYIDIGMDVHGEAQPVVAGQVILSSPGGACMHCMGFLNEARLAVEAGKYGNAGIRPQVVWPNGVLASIAVGIAVDLVTGWTNGQKTHAYLVYDGNQNTVRESVTLRNIERVRCIHFPAEAVGEPVVAEL